MTKITIHADRRSSRIEPEIQGQFAEHLGRCIYEGIYVGEDSDIPNVNGMRKDVVEALKAIRVPVLRWPGGCFADEYHWMDGIGPCAERKRMINTNWGGLVEDNSFGTHEYMELCRQLGCRTYITGNLGSGTPREMSEWVEYMTFSGESPMADLRRRNGRDEPWQVDYFGVGNESWGCGGFMRPSYYADLYRRYGTFVRDYGQRKRIRKIACGPNADDWQWMRTVLADCCTPGKRDAGRMMDGISLHYYTVPGEDWDHKGDASVFTTEEYYRTLAKAWRMETLLDKYCDILDEYDPEGRIGLIVDEWGTWYDVEPGTNPGFLYQQNTMRDAIVAAITLNLFNLYSRRVRMANIAQTVNVLQAMVLTDGERMVKTPTYHVFDLFKEHQGGVLLDTTAEPEFVSSGEDKVPLVSLSSSMDESGRICLTVANASASDSVTIPVEVSGRSCRVVRGRILAGAPDDKNTFDDPEKVTVRDFFADLVDGSYFCAEMPPCSVASFILE